MNRNGKSNGVIRCAVVDDDAAVRAALAQGLGGHFDIVGCCANGEDALRLVRSLPPHRRPDLVLLDIKMPGLGGIACCEALQREWPKLRIAMHTAQPVQARFEAARRAGADAYIVKNSLSLEQLAATLKQLRHRAGQCHCVGECEPETLCPPAESGIALLTAMDHQVMELLQEGMTIKEMAAHLHRHEQTVKKHLGSIRRKLRARTNAQALAAWLAARRWGLQK